ncbi:MAG: hypothetical protein QXD76_01125 [Sulfolobales archaeon]
MNSKTTMSSVPSGCAREGGLNGSPLIKLGSHGVNSKPVKENMIIASRDTMPAIMSFTSIFESFP